MPTDAAVNDEGEETLLEVAESLKKTAAMLHSRVSQEGAIVGWRGFHIDLDYAEECLQKLRLKSRGLR